MARRAPPLGQGLAVLPTKITITIKAFAQDHNTAGHQAVLPPDHFADGSIKRDIDRLMMMFDLSWRQGVYEGYIDERPEKPSIGICPPIARGMVRLHIYICRAAVAVARNRFMPGIMPASLTPIRSPEIRMLAVPFSAVVMLQISVVLLIPRLFMRFFLFMRPVPVGPLFAIMEILTDIRLPLLPFVKGGTASPGFSILMRRRWPGEKTHGQYDPGCQPSRFFHFILLPMTRNTH